MRKYQNNEELELDLKKKTAELHAKAEEISVINRIQEALIANKDINEICKLVGEQLGNLFNKADVGIIMYDSDTDMLQFSYVLKRGMLLGIDPKKLKGKGFYAYIINNAKPLLIYKDMHKNAKELGVEILVGKIPKSYLGVPLIVNNSVKGVIDLQDVEMEYAFNESDLSILKTIAGSLSIALENVRLFDERNHLLEETKQRAIELTIINTVGEGLARQLDYQAIIDLVGEKIRDVLNAQIITISIYNKLSNTIHHKYVFENDQRFYFDKPQEIDIDRKEILDTKKPLVFGTTKEIIEHSGEGVIAGDMPKSYLGVPIILNQVATGVITVQDLDREFLYKENDIRLLMTLASNMGVALENARLFEETNRLLNETRQSNAELAIINSVGEAISKQLDFKTVTHIVGDKVREIFNAEATEILLLNEDTNIITVPYSYFKGYQNIKPFTLGEGLTSKVIFSKQPLVIGTLEEALRSGSISDESVGEDDDTESYMGVPIISGQKVLGVVSVQNYKKNAFDDKSVRLLSTLSSNMGVALENARLFEETNRLLSETKQRNQELAVINGVQEGLVAKMEMQAIYDLVGEKIREIFDAQVVSIGSYDYQNKLCHFKYDIEKNIRFYEEPRKFNGIDNKLISSPQTILINENLINKMKQYGVQSPEPAPGTEMPKSAVWVPLIVGDVVKGHVSLQNVDRENAFSESDVRLLTTLANSMSVAIENARLFDETNRLLNETQQRNAELSILNAIQRGLVMEMDFQAIINLVGDKLREALNFQDIGIRLYDKQTNLLHFPYEYEHGKRLQIEPMTPTAISEFVLSNKKMILLKKNNEEELKKLGLKGTFVIPGTDWSKSLIAVPIILGDEARGLIIIENYEKENAFNESDKRLLMTLANSMSVALENARLFNETQQRNAELSILNIIQQGLVMEMNFQGIIDLVGDKLRETLGFQDIGIRLYNKETDMIHFPYEYEHGKRLALESSKLFGVSKYVIKNKKMILVQKNTDDSLKKIGVEETAVIPGTDRSKSLVAVPIMLGDDVRGLIIIENYEKEDAFSQSDVRLLMTLANSMSVALENARLFNETTHLLEETKQRAAELGTVNSISKALTSHLELDKLINLVGEKMLDLFKPNMAYVALYDKKSKTIYFPYGYGDEFPPLPLGEGLTSKIITTGEPLLINKEIGTMTAQLGIQRVGIPATSYLGVPIPVGDEIIGAISVQSTEQENRFSENDMRLLNTIAANVGVAINNAEAYRQLNKTVDQLNVTLKDLKSTQQQLIIQEKLASLGQLTAGIAHEIKNPLNFVNNFAEVSIELVEELREEFEKIKENIDSEQADNLLDILKDLEENAQRINQHGKRADSIVRSMLQHSRGKAGERQESDINAILEEDLNLAYHGMRARDASFNITIEKDFDKNLKKLPVVPQDISRVFLNIINNGFYEANKKKKIIKTEFSPILKVRTVDTENAVEVHIRDNGNGIPLEVRDKLFNPFFTTKPTGEGTGLGLSLSHDIVVKQHQGEIKFITELGEFTEFIIRLPKNGNLDNN